MQLLFLSLIYIASFSVADEVTDLSGTKRYEAFTGCESWNDALISCERKSGRLAIIDSVETQARTEAAIQSKKLQHWGFWINAHDSIIEGHWTTEEGEPLTFFNWLKGQPDNNVQRSNGCGGYDDYVVLWPINGYTWEDTFGSSRFGYVCEFERTGGNGRASQGQLRPSSDTKHSFVRNESPSPTTMFSPRPIKDKSTNTRYEAFAGCQTWHGSKAACKDKGGRLATITSQDTQTKIEAMLNQHGYTHLFLWFDLHDELVEGHWKTSDGFSQDYYNWATNEPNNYGGFRQCPGYEDCAVLKNRANEHKWNDATCDKPFGYICEFDEKENDKTDSNVTPLLFNGTVSKNPNSRIAVPTTNSELNDDHRAKGWSSHVSVPSQSDLKLNVVALVFSAINIFLLVGIAVFLYFKVWKKEKRTFTPPMFYKELEGSQYSEMHINAKA